MSRRARRNPTGTEWLLLAAGAAGLAVVGYMVFKPTTASAAVPVTPTPVTPFPVVPAVNPPPATPTTGSYLVSDGQPAGKATYNFTPANSGAAVKMAVGDKLVITLPDGSGARYFAYTSTGAQASSYQGLTFISSSTPGVFNSVPTGNIAYTYQASSSLGANAVEMVFQQLPVDANGNPVAGAAPTQTISLWVFVA
jgi:hypothetical protein